ncbi:MAG: hypothetical protein Q4C96_00925 [Planctomycetia bacterium]|nr:hypothetical protein [Planctomycetia bacterium]
MKKKVIALLSGGFDSALAVRIMQREGSEVEGLHVVTPFVESYSEAKKCADDLGIFFHAVYTEPTYIEILKHPLFGYGKAANPCLDCHLFMLKMAKKRMEETGACAVITGEVLGQRPMSQRRHHLEMLEFRSGLKGRLLRPISAKLLPITEPETSGMIDREKLYGFQGRARAPLHSLGKSLGLTYIPGASPGCCLTQKSFAPRVFDLIRNAPQAKMWEYELLRFGRHLRLNDSTRVIMGRNAKDCTIIREKFLENCAGRNDLAYFEPENYTGPSILLIGQITEETLVQAKMLQIHYSKNAHMVPEIIFRHFSSKEETLEKFIPVTDISVSEYSPL